MNPATSTRPVSPCEPCGCETTASLDEWQRRWAINEFEENPAESEEAQIKEELEEEAEPPRAARDPWCPYEKQVEDHRPTHLAFMTWCKWCDLGRGRGLQHPFTRKRMPTNAVEEGIKSSDGDDRNCATFHLTKVRKGGQAGGAPP